MATQNNFMAKIGWPVLTALMASGICFLIWQMWDVGLKLSAIDHKFDDVGLEIEQLKNENDELKGKLGEKSRAQWSLLREISSDMRDQHIDVQYVKTIQATVVLPNLMQQRHQPLTQLKLREEIRRQPTDSIIRLEKKLKESKAMRKEPLDGNLDHYIEQQQQLQRQQPEK
jgi:hypothetical protein